MILAYQEKRWTYRDVGIALQNPLGGGRGGRLGQKKHLETIVHLTFQANSNNVSSNTDNNLYLTILSIILHLNVESVGSSAIFGYQKHSGFHL